MKPSKPPSEALVDVPDPVSHRHVAEKWRSVKLTNVCRDITVGFVGSMSHLFVDDGVPLLRGQNIKPFSLDLSNLKFIPDAVHRKWKKSALEAGDVVIVRVGYPGTACVIPESFGPLNAASLVIVRPDHQKLNPHFLANILNSPWGKATVNGRLVGAAQQVFNTTTAAELQIPLPPMTTQKKIVLVLGAYDELIENNRRRIEILEEMARQLYREWFVQFRFPGHAHVPLTDSPLGKIPKGWEVKTLFELAEVNYGKNLPTKNLAKDGKFPVYGAAKIIGRHTEYTREKRTILTGCRGSVGQMQISQPRCFVTNNSFTFDPVLSDSFFWLFHALENRGLRDVVGGAAQPQITLDGISSVALVTPPQAIRKRFEEIVAPKFQLAWSLGDAVANLQTTRDLLLPRLISGELDVSELPIEVEEAARDGE